VDGRRSENGTEHGLEQRSGVRYRLCFPVLFKWYDQQGAGQQGSGFTRDISACGFFCFSPTVPPEGTSIEFEILLSPFQASNRALQVRATGRVTRLERTGKDVGFAAVTNLGGHDRATEEDTCKGGS
jgi:hypothetical protein